MNEFPPSLWDMLTEEKRPIWLYGTGNGADKILDSAERFGIRIAGVFASDGFVRNRFFREFPVLSLAEVRERCGEDFVVLLAFGSDRPEVIERIRELDSRHTLIIPEVPLYGGELFDSRYAAGHRDQLEQARSLFCDERSRTLYDDAVSFRLTGQLRFLSDTEAFDVTCASLLSGANIRRVVDGGAFRGDTARQIADTLHPESILAVEADSHNLGKLAAYAEGEKRCRILPVHAVLWNTDGTVSFSSGGSRGSGADGRSRRSRIVQVPSMTLDSLLRDAPADFIKLDVEGAEERVLSGGEATIRRDLPSMAVSLYHRTDDLWLLPLRIRSLLPEHRFFLRRVPCVPMWDLTLWAVRP